MTSTEAHIDRCRQKAIHALKPSEAQLEHGLELHRQSVVCDSFCFMPTIWTPELFARLNQRLADGAGVRDWAEEGTYLRFLSMTGNPQAAADFVTALQASGVTGFVQTVGNEGPITVNLPNIAARAHVCRMFHKNMFQAGSADEVRLAKIQGRTAVFFSLNGPQGNMTDPVDARKWLEVSYHLGVRLTHLSYNRRNHIAGGCTESSDDGLSDYGRDYIQHMNEVGMIVDTPHSSRQTTLDAAQCSSKPIMASHIGVKKLFNYDRCKTDEELKAIAGTDGLIGIYNYPNMLGKNATLVTLLDHVDAAVKLIGPDHVSIGTDLAYCPGVWAPNDLELHPAAKKEQERASQARGWKPEHRQHRSPPEHIEGSLAWTNWPLFTVGLVMRGYKDRDIQKIIGENLLRVLDANRPAQASTMQRGSSQSI